jgi:hypothetical protein
VKRQYYRYIRPFENPNQGVGNSTHAFAKILSTMRGDKYNAAVPLSRQYVASVSRQLGICLDKGFCGEKSVDNRIAGHIDAMARNVLSTQNLRGARGRSKMLVGDRRDDLPIHLLRPRRIDVSTSQARLHVRDRYSTIVRGNRPNHGRSRIALHNYSIGTKSIQSFADGKQEASAELVKRLVRRHKIKVNVGHNIRQFQDLVEQVPMLSGCTDGYSCPLFPFQSVNNREEFYCLRTRSNQDQNVSALGHLEET